MLLFESFDSFTRQRARLEFASLPATHGDEAYVEHARQACLRELEARSQCTQAF